VLCRRLKQAREQADLTQQDAARLLGLAQSVISRIETGERRVDVAELATLAAAYGKPVAHFFIDEPDGKDDGPPGQPPQP
jgi:transcriptional regulator with XRE-family HTH domain